MNFVWIITIFIQSFHFYASYNDRNTDLSQMNQYLLDDQIVVINDMCLESTPIYNILFWFVLVGCLEI